MAFGKIDHKWWSLIAVAVGVLMATIDMGIVSVSLPTIMSQFRADVAMIQWTVLSYLLVITMTLLPFGRLADMYGRKQIFCLGFAIFIVGSILCGTAGDATQLAIFRAFQAFGASALMANGLAIASAVFPPSERGKALGIIGLTVATGTTIGPSIGGVITQWLGWRWIFYVNVPIGIIGIGMALLILRNSEITPTFVGRRARFDVAGALASAFGLVCLVFAISGGAQLGLTAMSTILLYALAALAFGLFVLIERRVAAPMIDLALFQRKLFAFGSVAGLLAYLSLSANLFLLPFYLQLVLGYQPSQAGLLMAPTTLLMGITAPFSGWLSDRIGSRSLTAMGQALVCLAMFGLSRLDVHASYGNVLLLLVILGFGHGLFQSPNNSSVMGSVPRERYGIAAGFLSVMRNMGLVVGTALASILLVSGLASSVGYLDLDALDREAMVQNAGLVSGFMTGMGRAYLVAGTISICGVIASLSRGGSFRRAAAAPAH